MIKPFYSFNGTTIYHADCQDILPQLEPESIDLVVTSPPFNAGKEYEIEAWESLDAYRSWLVDCFALLWDVCASGAWLTIELQDMHVSPEHSHAMPGQKEQFNMATGAFLTVGLVERGWYLKGEAIWDRGRWVNNMAGKMACAPGSPALLVQHSRVLFFRKPGGRKGVYQFPEQSNNWKKLWCRTVWTHVQPSANPDHPATMPYSMAAGLVQGWSLPDSIILDPFLGSGTTIRAAQDLGRQAMGIEKRLDYCDLARASVSQQPLFTDA